MSCMLILVRIKKRVRYGLGFLDHEAKVNDNFGVKHKIGVIGAECMNCSYNMN